MTDDNLTVSVTEDDMNKSSYRGTAHPIKFQHHNKSPSASGRDFRLGTGPDADGNRPGALQFMRNQNRTFADSVIDHHQSNKMGSNSLVQNVSSSPTAIKSAASLPRIDMPADIHTNDDAAVHTSH